MNGDSGLTVDQIIQIFVAFGTILVAILAIWGDWVRYQLGLRPTLLLSLSDPRGEYITISESVDGLTMASTPAYYYHLKVSNKKRWTQAVNVRVLITALLMPAADGTLIEQPLAGPLQLMWRHAQYHPPYSLVGPDDFCDLGFIKKDQVFRLTPLVAPNNFRGQLEANQGMRIVVRAVADNAESNDLLIDIRWDGLWDDDQIRMSSHLTVKEVSASPRRF